MCLTLEHESIEICPFFFGIPTYKNALYLANVDLLLRLAGLGGCGGWRLEAGGCAPCLASISGRWRSDSRPRPLCRPALIDVMNVIRRYRRDRRAGPFSPYLPDASWAPTEWTNNASERVLLGWGGWRGLSGPEDGRLRRQSCIRAAGKRPTNHRLEQTLLSLNYRFMCEKFCFV